MSGPSVSHSAHLARHPPFSHQEHKHTTQRNISTCMSTQKDEINLESRTRNIHENPRRSTKTTILAHFSARSAAADADALPTSQSGYKTCLTSARDLLTVHRMQEYFQPCNITDGIQTIIILQTTFGTKEVMMKPKKKIHETSHDAKLRDQCVGKHRTNCCSALSAYQDLRLDMPHAGRESHRHATCAFAQSRTQYKAFGARHTHNRRFRLTSALAIGLIVCVCRCRKAVFLGECPFLGLDMIQKATAQPQGSRNRQCRRRS